MHAENLLRMKKIEEHFGAVIRRRRERKGFSQEEFASVAGVHRTYMSSIERGKVQVSIAVAQKLADALEVPLSRVWKEIETARQSSTD
jgi:transcriptional regulator with XRE-family HTH domain